MKIYLLIAFLILTPAFLLSQAGSAKAGTAGAQFLKVGLSARAAAMGDAYIVAASKSDAIFWNPGALARFQGTDISGSYVKWPAGIIYSGVSLAVSFGENGTAGLHFAGLDAGDMRVRTIYKPEGDGRMFTAGQFCAGLTYSKFLTDKFSVGATIKYIHEDFWTYKSKNWAVDIGTFYDTGFNSLVLGMSILNFGPDMAFDGAFTDYSDPLEGGDAGDFEVKKFSSYPLPLSFRFGMAMYVYQTNDFKILTAVDTYKPNDHQQRINSGLEFSFLEIIFLRGGYKFGYDEERYSFGAGIEYQFFPNLNIRIDYSYADMGVFNIVHRGSFGITF